jgi:hypothetical protein
MIMNRKFERRIVFIAGIWQIVMGIMTIFIYAPIYRREGLDMIYSSMPLPLVEAEAIGSLFGSIYMFIVMFGLFFILLGIVSIFLTRMILDNSIEKKIPLYFLICGIVCYLLMDIISTILLISASIMMLAKNKSIGILNHRES